MKCDAIILAAGYSSRMGTNKLSLDINGQSILSLVIDLFYPICEKIVVVGGHYYDDVKAITEKYDNVLLVRNHQYQKGMFSSVKRGVKEVSNDFFIIPGDYPLIKTSTCQKLLNSKGLIIVPVYDGNRGHPILIRKDLLRDLITEPISSNLKRFRDRYEVTYVNVDDRGILHDVDNPKDYEIVKKIGRKNL